MRPAATWPASVTCGATRSPPAGAAGPVRARTTSSADVRRELEAIVDQERAGVERRLDEASHGGPRAEGTPPADLAAQAARTDEADLAAQANRANEVDQAALRAMLRDVAARRLDQLDALAPEVGERIRGLAGLRLP